ncbi:TPA: hypothetical protein G8O12_003753 [Salmonella enterica]|uniref:Uncharacterized protein n=1 Tax=Salmonella enterica TaxID=28901 RepID=A0A742KZI9_SALER|nr:hypothetical protein [Salmonella enterica]HAF4640740.1 hypothetical protein [Salmonella enterica]HAF4746664.1 hypothetical protein [Salmonella enterica]
MLGKAAPRWQRRKASQLKSRNPAFAGFFVPASFTDSDARCCKSPPANSSFPCVAVNPPVRRGEISQDTRHALAVCGSRYD